MSKMLCWSFFLKVSNPKNVKSYIFRIFFLIIGINAASTIAIYWLLHTVALLNEEIVNKTKQLSDSLNELTKIELTANELNAPGNDIFESKNVNFEKNRFNNQKARFLVEVAEFRKNIDAIFPPNKDKMRQRLDSLQSYEKLFSLTVFDIFSNFEKKNLVEASKKMAQMDRTYSYFRQDLVDLRMEMIKINDDLVDQQKIIAKNQDAKTSLILIANFFFSAVFVLVGFFLQKRFRGDGRVLEFYKYALDQAAIVAMTDPKGKITFVNDKFSSISGYSKEELLGQDHRMLNSRHHPKNFFTDLWKTIGSGNVWHGEVRNQKKDKSLYWVDSTVVPMKDEKGHIEGYIAIRFDITQRKQAEELLVKQREELDQFFSLSRDLLCIAHVDGSFRKVSASYEKVLGFASIDIISKPFTDLVYPDDLPAVAKEVEKLVAGSETASFTTRCHTKDGSYKSISWTCVPANDGTLYTIGRDVTEQLVLEKRLLDAKQKAEAAAKTKAIFLANMSHEIRTPMHGIIGNTLLLLDTHLTEEQREMLATIKSSGDALLMLIDDILDFSKIEAGKMEIENHSFDIRRAVAEAVKTVNARASEKAISLKYNVDDKIPANLVSDHTRFRQILLNLLSNAVKFTAGHVPNLVET